MILTRYREWQAKRRMNLVDSMRVQWWRALYYTGREGWWRCWTNE